MVSVEVFIAHRLRSARHDARHGITITLRTGLCGLCLRGEISPFLVTPVHRDPFDRLWVENCLARLIGLVPNDKSFDASLSHRIDWRL